MNRRRAALFVVSGSSVIACVLASCGGRTTDPSVPNGYVDDAGAFHSTDGAIIFAPGSACVGFDAASWTSSVDPSTEWGITAMNIPCDADQDCAIFPPGYPYGSTKCSAGLCTSSTGTPPPCNVGVDGDEYCTALYQQFVRATGAKAIASCVPCKQWALNIGCISGGCLTGCSWSHSTFSSALFVERPDGGKQCELPCKE